MSKLSMEEYPVQMRSLFLAADLYAGADLDCWCFGPERELYYSTSMNENEFLGFLNLSGCLEYLYRQPGRWKRPVLLSDELGLFWIAENMYSENGLEGLIIVGPMFLSQMSVKSIENALRERISSVFMQRNMMRTLSTVPVVTIPMAYQYAKMLHYSMTLERILPSDFIYQNDETQRLLQDEEGVPSALRRSDPERLITKERLILQAIREGNMEYREMLGDSQDYENELISDSGNTIRDGKNTVLVLNALCSRAAVDGGVSVKAAREIELKYTGKIENVNILTELKEICGRMLEEYVRKVHEGKSNPLISRTIQESCDYIRANVTKELTVENIAERAGYSTYYFSKKFLRETGVKFSDYVKLARVEYAKIALITSGRSIQEISDALHFGTRNYFCKVFHDVVGVTPAAYRDRSDRQAGAGEED